MDFPEDLAARALARRSVAGDDSGFRRGVLFTRCLENNVDVPVFKAYWPMAQAHSFVPAQGRPELVDVDGAARAHRPF